MEWYWRSASGKRYSPHARARILQASAVGLVLIGSFFLWGAWTSFFLSFLLAIVTGLIGSQISIGIAILCLGGGLLLLAVDQQGWLQQSLIINYDVASTGLYTFKFVESMLVVGSFYFLCIGLLGWITQYMLNKSRWLDE